MQEQEIEDRFNAAVKVIKSLPKDGKFFFYICG